MPKNKNIKSNMPVAQVYLKALAKTDNNANHTGRDSTSRTTFSQTRNIVKSHSYCFSNNNYENVSLTRRGSLNTTTGKQKTPLAGMCISYSVLLKWFSHTRFQCNFVQIILQLNRYINKYKLQLCLLGVNNIKIADNSVFSFHTLHCLHYKITTNKWKVTIHL